jgi:hypothetical protein
MDFAKLNIGYAVVESKYLFDGYPHEAEVGFEF